jgi:hypothetical protein
MSVIHVHKDAIRVIRLEVDARPVLGRHAECPTNAIDTRNEGAIDLRGLRPCANAAMHEGGSQWPNTLSD